MTEVRHDLTAADRAAMAALRARLAANPIAITRASFDALFEQAPRAEGVEYSEASVGPRAHRRVPARGARGPRTRAIERFDGSNRKGCSYE